MCPSSGSNSACAGNGSTRGNASSKAPPASSAKKATEWLTAASRARRSSGSTHAGRASIGTPTAARSASRRTNRCSGRPLIDDHKLPSTRQRGGEPSAAAHPGRAVSVCRANCRSMCGVYGM
eukprot:5000458-Prymnesium_polylepis.1